MVPIPLRRIESPSIFNRPQPAGAFNRYATTPLSTEYYQSCIFWTRAAEIAALAGLVILGTIGGVFLYMQGMELAAVLCQLIVMKIGYDGHCWCANTLIAQKWERWEGVSRKFEELPADGDVIEVRRLRAHQDWHQETADQELEDFNRLGLEQEQLRQEALLGHEMDRSDVEDKAQRLVVVKQNMAISKIYVAYYSLMVNDHRMKMQPGPQGAHDPFDTRELIDFCRITPRSHLHEYAQAQHLGEIDPRLNAFLKMNTTNTILNVDQVLRLQTPHLQELLATGNLPAGALLPDA